MTDESGYLYTTYRWIADGFWNRYYWVAPHSSWEKLETFRTLTDIVYYPLYLSIVVTLIRHVFERYVYTPFGLSLGIRRTKPKHAPPNDALERAYNKSYRKVPHKQVQGLAKQVDWEPRQVERWLRLRQLQDKPSTLVKFCESGWRFTYYFAAFTCGFYVLWDKSWLWDIKGSWYEYPHHSVSSDVWWYYMLSMAFYWSLIFSQFFDTVRKDFWQMFLHHLTTICLLGFSWTSNLIRVGTLVLLLHDIADIFLEAAKMANYAKSRRICDILFALFTLVWITTRLGIYPSWIMYSTLVEAPSILEMFPAYYIFNSMLTLLLVLHIFWTYFIVKVLMTAFRSGAIKKDERSSSSDSMLSEDEANDVADETH